MHVVTRLRLLLVRRPWVWWSAVAATALVVGIAVSGAVRRLDEQRRSWGERRTVWVAAETAEPGNILVVEAHRYPVALIPAAAVTADPGAVTARQHVAVGEVIVDADVTPTGTPGLVPSGWVAVPVAQRSPMARVGDAVAAFADGRRLADGVVVATTDEQMVIAVPGDAAAAVTQAIPGGAVVVGLVGSAG